MTWFQYKGDTYLAVDLGSDSSAFIEGQDSFVKLTGLVDLSHASLHVPASMQDLSVLSLV
jgi:hypothetical protein